MDVEEAVSVVANLLIYHILLFISFYNYMFSIVYLPSVQFNSYLFIFFFYVCVSFVLSSINHSQLLTAFFFIITISCSLHIFIFICHPSMLLLFFFIIFTSLPLRLHTFIFLINFSLHTESLSSRFLYIFHLHIYLLRKLN